MKTITTSPISQKNKRYELRINKSGISKDEKPILAVMQMVGCDSGCWIVEDLRMGPNEKANPEFCAPRGREWLRIEGEAQAKIARSLLSHFTEHKEARKGRGIQQFTFDWFSYSGITPGRTGIEVAGFNRDYADYEIARLPILHRKSDALKMMQSIREFWENSKIHEDDDDVLDAVNRVKIENIILQPTMGQILEKIRSAQAPFPAPPDDSSENLDVNLQSHQSPSN